MDKKVEDGKNIILPEKNSIKNLYNTYNPILGQILQNVEQDLKEKISIKSTPTYKTRIKSFTSYYRKILRMKKPKELAVNNSLICLTDILGVRIICAFLEDLSVVEQQIKENYKVKEVEYKGSQDFKQFGYESVHVLIEIPSACIPDDLTNLEIPDELVCEIQIRTILQDAWAEVEHELIYKNEFSPFDMPLRRKLASMNASLSLADIIFQEIRDYQNKLQREVDERRESFYLKADELTSDSNPAKENSKTQIQRISPFVKGTIDDMILEAIHAHNTGDLDTAIEIYSTILNSKPIPPTPVLTVIRKHRGMAHFAKNEFDMALEDFKVSSELDNTNFRAMYYEGIVHTIQEDYQAACDCFTKSLDVNEYQSHAFYRRALVYFKLKDYEKSLADLSDAKKLGLDNEDCQNLQKELIKKFDMDV